MKILIKLKKFLLLQEANFVLLRASQQFISVILGFILIGMLEPTSYGIYIFYFTLISLFFNPLNGGIFFLSLKESSSASDIDKKNRFCELILFSIAASFILSTILITGLIIFNYLFHLAPGHLLIFCIFTISFQFLTVMRVIGAFIQGQNYPIHGQFGESIIRP